MKKSVLSLLLMFVIIFTNMCVFADAIAPEMPINGGNNNRWEINPIVYVIIAIVIVVVSCIISTRINGKKEEDNKNEKI